MPRNIRGWFGRVFDEPQISGGMRFGHQRAVLTARQTILHPRRVLVAGDAYAAIEGTTAQPAEENIFVIQFITVLTLFLL